MATFAEAEAEAHTHMHMDASKWTTRYIDTGQASTTFFQCVDDNGDLHIIEGIWRLIKAFMIMSDEHRDLCRRVSASHKWKCVVVRDGVIVPFLYFILCKQSNIHKMIPLIFVAFLLKEMLLTNMKTKFYLD